jgi:thiol-disulfide isomerase/thioredoxin
VSDLFRIVGRNDALLGQHVGMGLGRGDVLTVEMPVEIDGGTDFLHDGAGTRCKSSTPHLVAHGIFTKALMIRSQSSFAKKRLALVLAGGIAGVVVGLAGVYGIATLTRNADGDAACRPAVELAEKVAPFARGEMAAVNVAKSPLKLPALIFQDAASKPLTLDHWRGRVVLLNLWATWCVPCRKEMPALDALEQRLGGPGFEVVAVNIDTRDGDKPKAWLKEVGVQKLAYYADPTARTFQDLKAIGRAFGMPTTLLIDGQGCEIGTIAGPAEWASEDAIKLIKAAIGS